MNFLEKSIQYLKDKGYDDQDIRKEIYGSDQIKKYAIKQSGLLGTINLMKKIKDKFKTSVVLRLIAINAMNGERRFEERCKQIYNYLLSTVKFVNDPYAVEWVQYPTLTLLLRSGDCDDMALVSASMLEAVGIPTKFVIAKVNSDSFNHVYVYCYDNARKKIYPFDLATHKVFGFEQKKGIREKRIM